MLHADPPSADTSGRASGPPGSSLLGTRESAEHQAPDAERRGLAGQLRAWLSLLRIRTTLSAPMLTAVGLRAIKPGSSGYDARDIALACATAFFTIGFAQIINDIVDRDNDATHKPHRAIPSGVITVRAASLVMAFCAAMGLLTAALVSPLTVGFAALILTFGAAYSLWLKNTVLLGNLAIAIASSLLYQLGLTSWYSFSAALADGSGIVLLFILGDELFKTAEDKDGDAANGIRTIATRYGLRASAIGVTCCWALLAAIFVTNMLAAPTGLRFGAICLAVIGLPTSVASVMALRANSLAITRAHTWWKISWAPGLIAMLFIR